jgi:DNA invertase Pin-like site-specific DNA recombinase
VTSDNGTKRAAIYCRISRDKEGKEGAGLGVRRQEDDCRGLADRLGWEIAGKPYVDNDISAYSGKRRPAYIRLLEDIKAGAVDAVLVWHTDRLHRSPVELEAYIAAVEPRSVETRTVKAGLIDLATPTGRMIARTLGNIARFEVEHMIERQKAAKSQSRQMGQWQGGPRPFGYRKNPAVPGGIEQVPEEAAAIRDACTMLLNGSAATDRRAQSGISALAREWNARGLRTPAEATRGGGHHWYNSTIRRVLTRATNAALITHDEYDGRGRQVVATGNWEPIVSEDEWRAVKALLEDKGRKLTPGPEPRWLLTGSLRCAVCGGMRFSVSPSSGTRIPSRVYTCRPNLQGMQGGHVTRDAYRLNALVEAAIIGRLSQPDASVALVKPTVNMEELTAQRTALRARLDELGALFGGGQIDAQQMTAASAPLLGQIKETEDKLNSAYRSTALDGFATADDPAALWDSLPISRQRTVVRELIEHINVKPVRGIPRRKDWREAGYWWHIEDTVDIVWRP